MEVPLKGLFVLSSNIWFYDIEMYKNLFAFTAKELGKDNYVQYWASTEAEIKNCHKELLKFLKSPDLLLIGYNNLHYDNPVTKHFLLTKSIYSAYELSKSIIEDNQRAKWNNKFFPPTIDLMLAGNFIVPKRLSLKQLAVNIRFSVIKDLPYSPHELLNEEQIQEILLYNKNDVKITETLYSYALVKDGKLTHPTKDEIDLKIGIGLEYEIKDAVNKDRTMLAKALLKKLFLEPNGYDESVRTYREKIRLSDIISKKIKFTSPELIALLEKLKAKIIYPIKEKKGDKIQEKWYNTETFSFAGLDWITGSGGIHSLDKGFIFNNPNKIVVDYDVKSFYPFLMLKLGIAPAHFDKDVFLTAFAKILKDRTDAKDLIKITIDLVKKLMFTHKAEALKIVVNAIFGMMNSNLNFMYDPQAMMSVTVNGQLFLLMLVELFYLYGITIISANTDGVSIEIRADELSKANKIAKLWNNVSGFTLEGLDEKDDNKYSFYARRDVNNYVMKSLKGKIKAKGIFELDKGLNKAFKHPIVYEALTEYLLNGTNIENYIKNHQNIYDFCLTQRTNNDYSVYFLSPYSHNKMQKSNRFFVSTNYKEGGRLYKKMNENGLIKEKEEYEKLKTDFELFMKSKPTQKQIKEWEKKLNHKKGRIENPSEIDFVAGKNLMLANDLGLDKPIKEYKIDYSFYVQEVWEILLKIKFPDAKGKVERDNAFKAMWRENNGIVQEGMF